VIYFILAYINTYLLNRINPMMTTAIPTSNAAQIIIATDAPTIKGKAYRTKYLTLSQY